MSTCKTCRWWGRYGHNGGSLDPDGACERVDGTDQRKTFAISAQSSFPSSCDGEPDIDTVLLTGREFGCVLHEEKLSYQVDKGHYHYNEKPLWRVTGTNNDYVGDWHANEGDAKEEFSELTQ